jgi:hypothetical protein
MSISDFIVSVYNFIISVAQTVFDSLKVLYQVILFEPFNPIRALLVVVVLYLMLKITMTALSRIK